VAGFLDTVDDGKTKKKRVVGAWWWLIVRTWKAERKRLRFRNLGISILFCVCGSGTVGGKVKVVKNDRT